MQKNFVGDGWRRLEPAPSTGPVLALTAGSGELWAGGPGGFASLRGDSWRISGNEMPLTLVSAIAWAGKRLLAGGSDGLAVSRDGLTWERAMLDEPIGMVAAIASSPTFDRDATALVATLTTGIFRTTDGGRQWRPASFGLQSHDVTAMAWGSDDIVLAATAGGIYRTPDAGTSWRLVGPERGVAAVTFLADDRAVAVYEDGQVAVSAGGGTTWQDRPSVDGFDPAALSVTQSGTLLLGGASGILSSTDLGRTWEQSWEGSVLCFGSDAGSVWAGTAQGVIVTGDGRRWSSLPETPLADYRWLLPGPDATFVAGPYAGVARHMPGEGWQLLDAPPGPLSLAATAPDGSLLVSGSAGLARSTDLGLTWEPVLEGAEGQLALSAFEPGGLGWAASVDGDRLLATADAGRTWRRLDPHFGGLPVVGLDADRRTVRVLTLHADTRRLNSWRSDDRGISWRRGHSTVVTLPEGKWRPTVPGSEAARRLAVAAGLPADRIVDAAVRDDNLYVLLPAGEVRWRPVSSLPI